MVNYNAPVDKRCKDNIAADCSELTNLPIFKFASSPSVAGIFIIDTGGGGEDNPPSPVIASVPAV